MERGGKSGSGYSGYKDSSRGVFHLRGSSCKGKNSKQERIHNICVELNQNCFVSELCYKLTISFYFDLAKCNLGESTMAVEVCSCFI